MLSNFLNIKKMTMSEEELEQQHKQEEKAKKREQMKEI